MEDREFFVRLLLCTFVVLSPIKCGRAANAQVGVSLVDYYPDRMMDYTPSPRPIPSSQPEAENQQAANHNIASTTSNKDACFVLAVVSLIAFLASGGHGTTLSC